MTKKMTAFEDDAIKRIEGLDTSRPVFGIDLGTTNSAISVIVEGEEVIPIRLTSGKYTMPSCVMWTGDGFVVGEEAYENRHLANVVYSVKRHMQRVGKTVKFKKSETQQLTMTPAEVSAEILKGLVAQTGGMYGEIKDVVVTVPAYFDQNGRNATREACELAGLNLIDILNEPTAASLCYEISVEEETEDILIFDFGGGTFDITLARIVDNSSDAELDDIYGLEENKDSGRIVSCLGVEGDSFLGGDDVDQELYKIVCKKLEAEGIDTSKFSTEFKESLILRLEKFKKSSVKDTYDTRIKTITMDGKNVDTRVLITAEDFKAALAPMYSRCKRIVDSLLGRVQNQAKTMILVGGSTKNPHLHEFLKRDYPGFKINDGIGQDLAVTMGAAIKGKIAKFGDEGVQIFDVLPITIGIKEDGKMTPLIEAGTTLPANNSMAFTTVIDGQTSMDVELLQGKSANPELCVSLGKLHFTGIPEAKAGEPDLVVMVTVNANSVLVCKGKINGEEKVLTLDLTGETDKTKMLSKDEALIKRWRKTAEKMNEEDAKVLNSLIDGYPSISSKKDVMSFIRSHTEGMCTDRSKYDNK